MAKKRKLNSKNPKYWSKDEVVEPKIREKRLIATVPLSKKGKQTYMQYLKKIFRLFKKLDTWVTDQLYEIYPDLTKHMKK